MKTLILILASICLVGCEQTVIAPAPQPSPIIQPIIVRPDNHRHYGPRPVIIFNNRHNHDHHHH